MNNVSSDPRSEKEHKKDYMSQLYPNSNISEFLDKPIKKNVLKERFASEIPDIGETPIDTNNILSKPDGSAPSTSSENISGDALKAKEVADKMDAVIESVGDSVLESKLNDLRTSILEDVKSLVQTLQEELTELKDKKVPKRRFFDTGGAYKEELFTMATKVLDTVLIDLFEEIPDYTLIANNITKVYDDGTVENGIVTIGITVVKEGYRYDFKADIPILNGIMHSPIYIQRGLKTIPLTSDSIQSELDSLAFRKMDIDDTTSKKNLFNNTGENVVRRPDKQKFYEVSPPSPNPTGISSNSAWTVNKVKGM